MGELHDGQFFGMVAQSRGLVENLGAFALGLAEQMRSVEIFAVKGRVFAHDDGVKVFEPCLALGCDLIPSISLARQVQVLNVCFHALAFLPLNVGHFASSDLMATLLRLAHHGKTGVLLDLEGG